MVSNRVSLANTMESELVLKPMRNKVTVLADKDVGRIVGMLKEESSMTDAKGVEYVNYYGILNVKKKCIAAYGDDLEAVFSSSTFLKLQAGGAVSTFIFEAYLTRYAEMLRLYSELSKYDKRGDGTISQSELEEFIEANQIFELQRMDFRQVPSARKIAVRKFVFRHSRKHQLFVQDICSSPTIREMLEVKSYARGGRFSDIDPFSWFARHSVESVIKAFKIMDHTNRGYITQTDLLTFEGTKFTPIFIKRVFEQHVANNLCKKSTKETEFQMNLIQFADFVLAWRDRASSSAIDYFFQVFDIQSKGYLDIMDTHIFFKEVAKMWTLERNEGLDDSQLCENVINEIFEMALLKFPSKILKSDLYKCGKAYEIIGILADMNEFWKFENGDSEEEYGASRN
eukprot:g9086.t1